MLNSLKTKIVLSVLIAVILVASAGLITFRSLGKIKSAVDSVSRPNPRLEKVEKILSEASEAESGIRAYSLSKDEKYLSPYYRFLSNAESIVDTVRRLSGSDPMKQKDIYLLDSLVNEKLDVFFRFLDLKNTATIQITLADIADKIKDPVPEKASPTDTSAKAVAVPQHTFLSRIKALFDKKKKDSIPEIIPKPQHKVAKPIKKNIAESQAVKQMIAKAEIENNERAASLSQQELELLQKDARIMEGIRGLIRKIEKEERAQAGINLTEARHTAEDSSRTILVMCILAMVILLVFTYFIFADIASSNLYKKKLEESKKKTEELAKVKENFLSNMSHEIRTPLNAIVGFTDLLLKTKVEGEQKKYIDSVHTSSEHLLNVVNDILDFSKIEAGKLKVERTGFRPAELLEEVISSMRQVAQNKNISLNSILSTNLEQLILLGDPFRMKQVLLNLISNGIKFTEEGHVEVKCSASQDDVGNMLLKYDVSDTGIGIAPDKIKFIFEEFSQADTSITRQYGGTGLGLAICKKLAGLLNGSITASSTPRKGSSFSFTVLCSKGTEKDLPASRTTPSVASDRPQLERKKVLVVDDDDMNRLLLTTILRSYQMNIDEAEDGKKALALATSCAYDLILTDIHMPELSGVNMVRHIRALPDKQKATIPIIALTANIVKEDIQKYMTAGFNDYVLKPYNEAILFEKIARVLNLDPGSIDLIRKSETINVEPTSGKAYSLEELNRISNGNGPFVSKMIASFIHNTRSNITYLKDELELEHWEHIGKIAHKMGPSCYKFKLLELHGLLRDLEYKTLTEKNYSSVPSLVSHVESIANPILIALEEELKKTQTS